MPAGDRIRPEVRPEPFGRLERLILGSPRAGSELERLRARVVALGVVFGLPFWFAFGLLWLAGGSGLGLGLNVTAALLSLLLLGAIRRGWPPLAAARGYAALLAATTFSLVLFVRGFDLTLLAWQFVIPIAGMLFQSTRPTVVWSMGIMLEFALLGLLDVYGALPEPQATFSPAFVRVSEIVNVSGVLALLTTIAGVFVRTSRVQRQEREALRQQLVYHERLASLGSLSASIGHEINNPLSFAIHSLEYLRGRLAHRAVEPAEAQALDDACEGTERVRRIASRLNAFARISTETKPIAVQEAVTAAMDMATSELRNAAEVNNAVPPDLCVQASDELTQVFLNLLVNAAHAIRASRQGKGQGRITIRAHQPAESVVIIEVEDDGSGIAEADLHRIFEPFFTSKPAGEGTGLGLAISRDVVSKFGGTIDVRNVRPHGARFLVQLPAARPLPQRSCPDVRALPSGARVLIVDDEPALLRGLARMLREQQVTTARSGPDALRRLRELTFDLVLCDVMMPGMSGPELHAKVRAELGAAVADRFVFMTGGAFAAQENAYLVAQGCATLAKPLDADALRDILSACATVARPPATAPS